MKPKIHYLTLLLFSVAALHAQDLKDEPQVSIIIDFVSWGEDLSGLEVSSGKSNKPVKALGFRYSEPFEYSGPQTLALALGKGSDKPIVPGAVAEVEGEIPKSLALAREKDPELASFVKLPANSSRVTILLSPGPQRSLLPHVFNDDPAHQRPGMVRVHNLSPHPVSIRTTAEKPPVELEPDKSSLLPVPGKNFVYELAYKVDDVWKIQENNMVSVRPNEQIHMCVLRSEASFFTSSDGSRGDFMQVFFLRRTIE